MALSVRLDQWQDGPAPDGDSTGNNNEQFVNGNLNASKAHYNEGDSIPYRAVMDDLQTGHTYSIVIQWDTVDSGAYALDYLTSYNYSFEGSRHPGEPDVTPTTGVSDLSIDSDLLNPDNISTVLIPSDPRLLDGFGTGTQFGVTDGLDSGQPSGAQYITVFGAVTGLSTSQIIYSPDGTKASIVVSFTYTGGNANNADSVVLAWGGHIASSLDWADDAGETVQTASDISGSPYHTRILNLVDNGSFKSVGNQDRSLSAGAVTGPIVTDTTVLADQDNSTGGIGDTTSPGDDDQSGLTGTISVTNVSSINFLDQHLDPVIDTSGFAVTSGGVALTYFWDGTGSTLYASTVTTSLALAQTSAVFTFHVAASSPFDYTFTLLKQVDHLSQDGTADDNTENNLLIDLTYTAVGAGTTTGVVHVSLDDDMPTIGTPTAAAAIVLDESPVPPNGDGIVSATGDFSANFAAAVYGADGPGSVSYKLMLSAEGIGSGLYALNAADVLPIGGDGDGIGQGLQILLYVNDAGTVVTGSTALNEGGILASNTYFTITVDNNPASATFGDVTFAQTHNIWHDDITNPDDPETLATTLASGLQLVQTVTDFDGDSASAALNLGAGVFTIQDDGPHAAVANTTAAAIVLDESPVPPNGDGIASATGDFSANFAAAVYGTDGAGSVSYKLMLSAEGIGSGLYALNAADVLPIGGDGDGIGQGLQILLYVNDAGTVVTGSTALNEGGILASNTYFTITVDNNPASATFGDVTFAQTHNIWHDDITNPDDPETLATTLASGLQLVQTVKDADGDSASAALDLGANVFTIQDDGPHAAVANTTAAAIVLDESPVPPNGDGIASATGDFSANFAAANFGTDGAGSVSYKLMLSAEGIGSGLYALNAADVLPIGGDGDGIGQGLQILLYVNDAGTVVTGSTALNEGGILASNTYFTITVDNNPASATFGDVTFAQTHNIWHDDITNPDDPETLATTLASGLQLVQTVKDADGDSASAALDLGANVFTIQDDGPHAAVANTTAAAIVLDESPVPPNGDGIASATGDFSANFAAANFGTDGAGSVSYKLMLSAEGIGSGLYALNAADVLPIGGDGDGIGQGLQILLYVNDAGTVVTGSTALNEGGILASNTYFTITVDNNPASATFGDVTFAQTHNIWHDDITNPDDPETLATTLASGLQLVQTVKDADGDSASAALDLGANVFTIQDDGPTITVGDATGDYDAGAQGTWTDLPGADGYGSLGVTFDSYEIDTHGSVTTTTFARTGDFAFEGSITDDFNNDGTDETVDFTLTFDPDSDSYDLQVTTPPSSTSTFDTSQGSLAAGGPDAVQTLLFGGSLAGNDDIVFFGAVATAPIEGIASPPTNDIEDLVVVGETDLTEAQIQALGPIPTLINAATQMNVSTSGIGINNNNLNGSTAGIQSGDESFVVNPETVVDSVTVFIDNSVGGYNPATEELYYTVYYTDGSTSGPTDVTADMLDPVTSGVASGGKSFDIDGGAKQIDAVQLTMGVGTIKIPVISFTVETVFAAEPLHLDFTATLVDGDGDTHQDQFKIDLSSIL